MLFTLLTSCAPGSIFFEGGHDALRTALYQEGADELVLVLSNGEFGCDFPDFDDPQKQSLALVELTTAACRENARHLIVHLFRQSGADWADVQYQSSADSPPRSTAEYIGIEEAELVEREALSRAYTATEVTHIEEMQDGWVHIKESTEILRGSFLYPEVNGTFAATDCGTDADLFDVLKISPVVSCP